MVRGEETAVSASSRPGLTSGRTVGRWCSSRQGRARRRRTTPEDERRDEARCALAAMIPAEARGWSGSLLGAARIRGPGGRHPHSTDGPLRAVTLLATTMRTRLLVDVREPGSGLGLRGRWERPLRLPVFPSPRPKPEPDTSTRHRAGRERGRTTSSRGTPSNPHSSPSRRGALSVRPARN